MCVDVFLFGGGAFISKLKFYLFQGSFLNRDAMAHVLDIPAYISPHPTNAGISAKAALKSTAKTLPNKTIEPAAMRTCLSIDIAALSKTASCLPASDDIPPDIIDTLGYPAFSSFSAALLARIPLLQST